MRTLEQALFDHELITLRVIGEWWEIDLAGMEKTEAVEALTKTLASLDMRQERQFLPPEEVSALDELVAQGGRVAVASLNRSHGEVRMMGPGRMERDEPWLDPVSPLEALWYRGFLYRAFDETAEGVLEFYYLPEEMLAQFPEAFAEEEETLPGSLVPVDQPDGSPSKGITNAVDDLTTLLAVALLLSVNDSERLPFDDWLLDNDRDRHSLLLNLANERGWLKEGESGLRPTRAAVDWLKKTREAQLFELADAWTESSWNDLCHTPDLICEGEQWQNDPILARTALLDALPRNSKWYSVPALIESIRSSNPDFQRPDGNYDTWYIRDTADGGYLAGFDSWDRVEGRLLNFLILGPLKWLGVVIVTGSPDEALFRFTEIGLRWLDGRQPSQHEENVPLIVHADGSILVAHNADRHDRFQVMRIAELEKVDGRKPYHYRLTPASLALAAKQGISADQVARFLTQSSTTTLPKSVQRAMQRWAEQGVEGRLESVVVLRVNDAAILETIRSNARTRDFLGEALGDLSVTVHPGKWEQLRAACAQLGLFIDEKI